MYSASAGLRRLPHLAVFVVQVQQDHQVDSPHGQRCKHNLDDDTSHHSGLREGVWQGQDNLANLQVYKH